MKLSHCDAILSECCFQFICIYTSKSSGNVYFLRSDIPFSICNNKKKMFVHTKKISVPFLCVIEFWWHSQSKKFCCMFLSFSPLRDSGCKTFSGWNFAENVIFHTHCSFFSGLTYKYFCDVKSFFCSFFVWKWFHQY